MRTSTCVHCGAELRLRSCGCWVDRQFLSQCADSRLHKPVDGVQPERCPAWPADVHEEI